MLIKVSKRVQKCPWLKYLYKEVRYECQIPFVATKLATVDGDNANGIKSGGNISDQICVTFDKSLSRICIKRFTMFSCAVRRVCLKLKVTLFSSLFPPPPLPTFLSHLSSDACPSSLCLPSALPPARRACACQRLLHLQHQWQEEKRGCNW